MSFKSLTFRQGNLFGHRHLFSLLISVCLTVALTSCDAVTTKQYEATALTTLTWQVKYSIDPVNDKDPRFEEFASNSLLNRNGEKPIGAILEDDKGLWWPILPPRPRIDEVEQRQQPQEEPSSPELLRSVKYQITYQQNGKKVTLPTNYDVYRQVARVYSSRKPLRLTLGINNASVTKAELAER